MRKDFETGTSFVHTAQKSLVLLVIVFTALLSTSAHPADCVKPTLVVFASDGTFSYEGENSDLENLRSGIRQLREHCKVPLTVNVFAEEDTPPSDIVDAIHVFVSLGVDHVNIESPE